MDGDSPVLVGLLWQWYQPCDTSRPTIALKVSQLWGWMYEKIGPAVTSTTASSLSTQGGQSQPGGPSTVSPPPATSPGSSPAWPTAGPPPTSQSPGSSLVPTAGPSVPGGNGGSVTIPPPTTSAPLPPPQQQQHKPMTVSSSSASGVMSNTSSSSDVALLAGHLESSLSYSLGTASVEPDKPALSNTVSVGWADCHELAGALGMSYSLAYSFVGEGSATSASAVNATCSEVSAVHSQGWSMSSSGLAPVNVRAFVQEHLTSIPGLPRQPTLKYL